MSPCVTTLEVPTPWSVGPVNCYLIEDAPLTLVDTGPHSRVALTAIEMGLAERGFRIEDLGRIILTHHHPDHVGLATIIARRADAEVCALDQVADWLSDPETRVHDENAFVRATLVQHGVPVVTARQVDAVELAWATAVDVHTRLIDGSTIDFAGTTLSVHHRPGHSPTDTVFHDDVTGDLFAGDHLIADIDSNALLARASDASGTYRRSRALVQYMSSLAATRAMDVRSVLPGHGGPILDHRQLIDTRTASRERRLTFVLEVITAAPSTAFDVAARIWGRGLAGGEPHLTMSKTLGYLDVLVARGDAVEEPGDVARFRAAAR
ncbi:MAG: fold metallo-hydrolase [Solirubrobacterales bacterium]|nr:fold metallo-hydrolase [Solirubrobacterales bacterium]